jgi:hypothetical protein
MKPVAAAKTGGMSVNPGTLGFHAGTVWRGHDHTFPMYEARPGADAGSDAVTAFPIA